MSDRRQKLIEYCCDSDKDEIILVPLIDEVVFLENRLEDLKKLPFIKINPKNPMQQKSTPAQKQYKDEIEGTVVEALPSAQFKVELPNGHQILATDVPSIRI